MLTKKISVRQVPRIRTSTHGYVWHDLYNTREKQGPYWHGLIDIRAFMYNRTLCEVQLKNDILTKQQLKSGRGWVISS